MMKSGRMIKYGTALMLVALFMAFGAMSSVSGTEGTSLEQVYMATIEDAKIAEESEICSNLIPIIESNENLTWKGEPGNKRVLVLTFAPYFVHDNYMGHEGENLTTS